MSMQIPSLPVIIDLILKFPRLHLVWGDVGTGKSTLALQVANKSLQMGKKVFYMNTKFVSNSKLIQRILGDEQRIEDKQLIIWQNETLKEQKKNLLEWDFLLHQLSRQTLDPNVGLLIIDEITPHFLLEKINLDTNQMKIKNEDLIFILATIMKIIQKYSIPVLITNKFKLNQPNSDEEIPKIVPFGGKILDFWLKFDRESEGLNLKILRTSRSSQYQFEFMNTIPLTALFNQKWIWRLTENGFQ